MRILRILAPLAVAAACSAAALPATASAGTTGNYSGNITHPIPSWAPGAEPFESKLVIRVLKARVTGVVATVRYFCQEPAVNDVRILKSYRIGSGPKIGKGGGFSFRLKGVTFDGEVRSGQITGNAHGGNHECGVSGAGFRLARVR